MLKASAINTVNMSSLILRDYTKLCCLNYATFRKLRSLNLYRKFSNLNDISFIHIVECLLE